MADVLNRALLSIATAESWHCPPWSEEVWMLGRSMNHTAQEGLEKS